MCIEKQDEQDRQVGRMRKIKNEIILHILPDPPAKRILFFFSTNLSCNRPDKPLDLSRQFCAV